MAVSGGIGLYTVFGSDRIGIGAEVLGTKQREMMPLHVLGGCAVVCDQPASGHYLLSRGGSPWGARLALLSHP